MNKLLTFNGTQPIYLGDINFAQASAGEMYTLLARALMGAESNSMNAILQGVDISYPSAGVVQISSDIVVINGEVLPVEGGSISAASTGPLYVHVSSVLSGSRTFKDGTSHDCYETRKATINTTSEGGVAVSSLPRLYHRPEDVSLVSDVVTGGFIRGANLKRKNGIWFLSMSLDLNEGSNKVEGTVSFRPYEDVTEEIFNSISGGSFACMIQTGEDATYSFTTCTVSKDSSTLSITIELSDSTVTHIASSGGSTGHINTVLFG